MERERVACNSDDIDNYFDYMKRVIGDVQAAFVFKIDESGFQDFSDAKETTVIVPASYPGGHHQSSADNHRQHRGVRITITLQVFRPTSGYPD